MPENTRAYAYACKISYESPYNEHHFPPALFPEEMLPEDFDTQGLSRAEICKALGIDNFGLKGTPLGYRRHQWAPALAFSIREAEKDPMSLLREYADALKVALSAKFKVPPPTLYATLMPSVPGGVGKWNRTAGRAWKDDDWLAWAREHDHPGIVVDLDPPEGRGPVQAHKVSTLRYDATWQAAIYFDPIPYIAEEWTAGFKAYRLHVFASDGEFDVYYQDLHDDCPLIGVIVDPGFTSCAGCAHNNIFCRARFLREHLERRSPAALRETLWLRDHVAGSVVTSFYPRAPRVYGFDDHRKFIKKVRTEHVQTASAGSVGGSEWIGQLKMPFARVHQIRDNQLEGGKKAAVTRSDHDTRCGRGNDVCVLKDMGCHYWRGWRTCSRRRYSEAEFDEEARVRFETLKAHATPVDALQRHVLLVGYEFQAGTDLGRLQDAQFCGVHRSGGTTKWYLQRGPARDRQLYSYPDWNAMKRWLRRWAPWELERIAKVEMDAPAVDITEHFRILFYAAQSMSSLHQEGMFGGTSRQVHQYDVLSKMVDGVVTPYGVRVQADYMSIHIESMWDFRIKNRGFTQGGILPA